MEFSYLNMPQLAPTYLITKGPKRGIMEYELIDVAKAKKKGGIIIKVIGVGEVSTGTGSRGDWKKQTATLQDNSGEMPMVLWGDQVGTMDQGKYYKIEAPFWSMYKEQVQLSLGNFGKLHLADVTDLLDAASVTESPPGQTQLNSSNSKLPKIPQNLKDFVQNEDLLLLEIGQIIEDQHKANGIPINGQKIGLHTKEIYKELKKTNLIKASSLK